jgi:Type IV secretory system Conjugative DNA transfer
MAWRPQINEKGNIACWRNTETGEVLTAKQYEQRIMMQGSMSAPTEGGYASPYPMAPGTDGTPTMVGGGGAYQAPQAYPQPAAGYPQAQPYAAPVAPLPALGPLPPASPLAQPGAVPVGPGGVAVQPAGLAPLTPATQANALGSNPAGGMPPSQAVPQAGGPPVHSKNLRLEGVAGHDKVGGSGPHARKSHGFLDATSIAILLPTLVLLALIIAAAHKKRLFPWQTIRTFNPPSGLMTPRDYERSFVCPPNGRRHGRLGKKNPNATWTDTDGVVIPFGFLARTHLPVTIPMGRLPNKNMFIVAPSGSGKTTLMRAVIKAMLAKPAVIIALEAKANDPNLDEKREGFKYTVLPEAQHAGFRTLYFNPLDSESVHWNPLDQDANGFATSIVQDINSLDAEEQHWAERDMGYIEGLAQLLKWGAVQVMGEDENGQPSQLDPLPCNPYGLMKLVNNRRNIVESMRKLKNDPNINAGDLSELTQRLSSIIRTDSDWDKNIQGVRGRLRMFKNPGVLRVTQQSNIDLRTSMHEPTVLIFGAPASLGPDAESLASCFVHQLQQALHTRYGTKSVLPLFAFFDEYQTLNIDLAGRLSAIVRGANGGLTVILQNVSQITGPGQGVSPELKTIFSNSAIRVCLHNADETTAKFFSEEIGKHAVVVPGIADHYQANGFGIFPTSWNRIHSQQVVARVDTDSIKRMEKHHALVYLSPAGDPEFGETKPFMCDLRGIEEIARLHLLHNVNARKQGPGGQAQPGPVQAPGFASGAGGGDLEHNLAAMGNVMANAASAVAQAPAFASRPAPIYDEVEAGSPYSQMQTQPQPYMPVAAPQAVPSSFGVPTPAAAPVAAAAASGAGRICPNCAKAAGKGKFCIECGQFIGLPQAQSQASQVISQAQGQLPGQGQLQSQIETTAQLAQTPAASGIIPSYAEVASAPADSVDSFGNPIAQVQTGAAGELPGLSALPSQTPTPRYGGMKPQTREAMPAKRGLFENPADIADAAKQMTEPNFNQTRKAVTSLTPDVTRMGLGPDGKKGVEF